MGSRQLLVSWRPHFRHQESCHGKRTGKEVYPAMGCYLLRGTPEDFGPYTERIVESSIRAYLTTCKCTLHRMGDKKKRGPPIRSRVSLEWDRKVGDARVYLGRAFLNPREIWVKHGQLNDEDPSAFFVGVDYEGTKGWTDWTSLHTCYHSAVCWLLEQGPAMPLESREYATRPNGYPTGVTLMTVTPKGECLTKTCWNGSTYLDGIQVITVSVAPVRNGKTKRLVK